MKLEPISRVHPREFDPHGPYVRNNSGRVYHLANLANPTDDPTRRAACCYWDNQPYQIETLDVSPARPDAFVCPRCMRVYRRELDELDRKIANS